MLDFLGKSSCNPNRSCYLCCLLTHILSYGTHSAAPFLLFSPQWHKQLAVSTEQALTQMVGVSLVTDINRNCKNQFYTIIQNLSFVLLHLFSSGEQQLWIQLLALLLSTESMVHLAFQVDTFLCEVCYGLPRIWTFLHGLCVGLEHSFYSQLWLPGKSRKRWWSCNTTLFSQAVLANLCVFRYHRMIRVKDWKRSLHTWSTACCLWRACSRVDRFWFRER